ncbi:hypothetical protein Clacol_004664 [Clathrus columnatus]|uniref:Glutathione S-transferase n=1 Tax=Clathrus columnatus TaxID=1419009 RepID=A0AAV5ACR8_9AGAM|nr:hypothetical protein Clacol_004664 [Clathrus columnatus]
MDPQVTVFAHGKTPNPLKVMILLEELGVKYAVKKKEMGDVENGMKRPDFLKINPNGRVPAIIDHTANDFIVWESGAILLYLAEKFGQDGRWVGKSLDERAQVWEWLMFQVSGLGPMQGQLNWFKHFHPVKNLDQSVYDRYSTETYRVYGVLEKRLTNTGNQWLALDCFTIVDIAFYPWLCLAAFGNIDMNRFPKLKEYVTRISELPSVKAAYAKLE